MQSASSAPSPTYRRPPQSRRGYRQTTHQVPGGRFESLRQARAVEGDLQLPSMSELPLIGLPILVVRLPTDINATINVVSPIQQKQDVTRLQNVRNIAASGSRYHPL